MLAGLAPQQIRCCFSANVYSTRKAALFRARGSSRFKFRIHQELRSPWISASGRAAPHVDLDVAYNKEVYPVAESDPYRAQQDMMLSCNGSEPRAGGRSGSSTSTAHALVAAWKDEIAPLMQHYSSKLNAAADERVGDEEGPGWLAISEQLIDRRCADNIRMLVVDSVNTAKAGHPGLPMGLAEVGYVLWKDAMKYNPQNPLWFNRDRFVLSAGHGCLLQYICLHLAGYDLQLEDLKRLCKLDGRTPGHPENVVTPGIEVTTGPLGQGVANAVGLAIAERHLAARFNKPDATIVDHRTYCIMGDGCAMEGISNEAASLAGHLKLDKLTVIYDDNHNTIDGPTDLAFSEDVAGRFRALGWHTITIDNLYDDLTTFRKALMEEAVAEKQKPTFIQVKSSIGRLSTKEGTAKAHHGTFDEEDVKRIKEKMRWPLDRPAFYIIPMVYERFKSSAQRGECLEREWNETVKKYVATYSSDWHTFRSLIDRKLPPHWADVLPSWSQEDKDLPLDATRSYSQECLNALVKVIPGLLGGSADLASSNKAVLEGAGDFTPDTPWGRNIHYGVREHAMAAISNGLALHGSGLLPFAATFLTFSDYMKNAMRLSAMSRAQVLYILTHDSIGLGEDGPTHQPVEHLVGLRAIPNLVLLRPADANETAGAYRVAISRRHGPTAISLSRQKVQAHLAARTSVEGTMRGGYILTDDGSTQEAGAESEIDLILLATGTELALCQCAAEALRRDDIKVRVVSLVSWELFDEQEQTYRDYVLPPKVLTRLAVEAGSPLGWREFVGPLGEVLGVSAFGASGAYLDVFHKYGFTAAHVEETARRLLTRNRQRV